MALVRWLNRASKPGAYQYPPNTWRQQPEFIIYIKSPNLSSQSLNNSNTQSHEDLNKGLNSDKDLDSSDDEDLDSSNDENLNLSNDEDLHLSDNEDLHLSDNEDLHLSDNEDLTKDLTENLAKDLIIQFCNEIKSEDLSRQLYESLDVLFSDNQSYQSLFLSKDRTDESQNLSENSDSVKLFQLFFLIKEMKNIVKQINQQTAYINFKFFWKSLTITEIYHYLECLVYIEIQSLQELKDHWSQLNFSIKSCLSQRCFKQIWHAFII